MGPDNVYTYWDILKIHFIVRIGFCTTLSHAQIKLTKHSFLNSIRVWSGSKPFLQMLIERERERDWYMHIISGKSKCIDRSTSREREREREMCVLFEFRHFFLTLRTRLRISKLRVYLCKRFWSTRCPWVTAFAQMESKRKRFCFLKEEQKCSDSSVVRG